MQIGKEILYLTRDDVQKVNLTMPEVMSILEQVFLSKSKNEVEMPPKLGVHTPSEGFAHAMPCYIPSISAMGIKWVNGCPTNMSKGLPFVGGLSILNDANTTMPICIMDCTLVTALRTGAKSGICAKYLAKKDSFVLGLIGCGLQGKSNLEALLYALPNLKEVYVYDIKPEASINFAQTQSEKYKNLFNIKITAVNNPKDAVINSDVMLTAGLISLKTERIIEDNWLKEGVTLIPVDLDCLYQKEAVAKCHKIFTDDLEIYDIFDKEGFFSSVPKLDGEFCQVLAGNKTGRASDFERILVLNNGMAIDDISISKAIFDKAVQNKIGTILPL